MSGLYLRQVRCSCYPARRFAAGVQFPFYLHPLCSAPARTVSQIPSFADGSISRFTQFKAFEKRILVATDIFGRGIDVERVNVVINYVSYICPNARIELTNRTHPEMLTLTSIESVVPVDSVQKVSPSHSYPPMRTRRYCKRSKTGSRWLSQLCPKLSILRLIVSLCVHR